jgi:dynein heavy chain
VLSVIAQQILTIQLAIQAKLKRFIFEDTEIDLDSSCSVMITMNPGYAGG